MLGFGRGRWADVYGFAMLEVVMAAAIAGLMLPLAMVVVADAGRECSRNRMEGVSLWVVPVCVQEFDEAEEVSVCAVAADGRVMGRVTEAEYQDGLDQIDGMAVRYLCRVSVAESTIPKERGLKRVMVSFESPAKAMATMRRRLEYQSLLK